jgi:hypothetical protein
MSFNTIKITDEMLTGDKRVRLETLGTEDLSR